MENTENPKPTQGDNIVEALKKSNLTEYVLGQDFFGTQSKSKFLKKIFKKPTPNTSPSPAGTPENKK